MAMALSHAAASIPRAIQMRYSSGASIKSGYLKVSELHSIYYETFGNPSGQAAVFLHGGPGAGCNARHAQFFNPARYHVVLFDQRGCGKSTPRGCLQENTTLDLVDDLEKLRKHLTVERWLVFGGSWGVTLGLAYAEAYPDAVFALILRGVCLFRQHELDWIYKQGANLIFPFAWRNFVSVLEPDERSDVLTSFHKRLTSTNPFTQLEAVSQMPRLFIFLILAVDQARAWFMWEISLSFFSTRDQSLAWDGKSYRTASGQIKLGNRSSIKPDGIVGWDSDIQMPSQLVQARLECHYAMRNGFLTPNQLLEGIKRIRHIPCTVVHGRFDFVCPVSNAFDLHQAWPEAELRIVGDAGHSMYEKGISEELVKATDAYKKLE